MMFEGWSSRSKVHFAVPMLIFPYLGMKFFNEALHNFLRGRFSNALEASVYCAFFAIPFLLGLRILRDEVLRSGDDEGERQ